MNNASQLLNEVGQGRFKCCKPWPNAEDDNTSCAVSSRGCLNAPPLLETFTAAPKKFLKKLTSTIALEWPNSATNLSVNCQIEIGIVRNQTDILTRITPCYRQEEWHEQCECYHYGIRSGKELKFRDQSLFIALRGVGWLEVFFLGGGWGGHLTFRRTERGIIRKWEPKGGRLKKI